MNIVTSFFDRVFGRMVVFTDAKAADKYAGPRVVLRHSDVVSRVPELSNMLDGEVAVNVADDVFYKRVGDKVEKYSR